VQSSISRPGDVPGDVPGDRSGNTSRRYAYCALFATLALAIACGREPTDPSQTDISGWWQSLDRDIYVYNLQFQLTQSQPGLVTGKWRSIGRRNAKCIPFILCGDSSTIQGRNEVAQVVLELDGLGVFVGELVSQNELRGVIRSDKPNFHLTLARVATGLPIPVNTISR